MQGADPEFLNKGAEHARAHIDRAEGKYDRVLASTSIVKLYLNSYTHTHTQKNFRSIYELKYWRKGKCKTLKTISKSKIRRGPGLVAPP